MFALRRLKEHVVGVIWIGTDVQRRRILDPRSANRGYLRATLLLSWSAASRLQVPLDLFCGLSPHQGDGRRSLLVIVTAISLLAVLVGTAASVHLVRSWFTFSPCLRPSGFGTNAFAPEKNTKTRVILVPVAERGRCCSHIAARWWLWPDLGCIRSSWALRMLILSGIPAAIHSRCPPRLRITFTHESPGFWSPGSTHHQKAAQGCPCKSSLQPHCRFPWRSRPGWG